MDFDTRYEEVCELGKGGMGTVYLCRDARLERLVAIKVMQGGSERQRARFLREGRALARLSREGVIRVHDMGTYRGGPCLVLEYLPGQSLHDHTVEQHPIPVPRAAELVAQLAETLASVHRAGILHRDLKPENVILHDGRPVLIDFGLCKGTDEAESATRLTELGTGLGTPGFMPPEQLRDALNADRLSDVFGLGATLYALLTRRAPFQGRTVQAILRATLCGEITPLTQYRQDVDARVETILTRCLRPNLTDRYPSAEAVADDLRAFLGGEPLAPFELRVPSSVEPDDALPR